MAKATTKRSVRSNRHPAGDDTIRRFVDGPVRSTRPTQRNVQSKTVDLDARTLTAIVATGTLRVLEVYDDDLRSWIEVEEVIAIEGMDLSRVESTALFFTTGTTIRASIDEALCIFRNRIRDGIKAQLDAVLVQSVSRVSTRVDAGAALHDFRARREIAT